VAIKYPLPLSGTRCHNNLLHEIANTPKTIRKQMLAKKSASARRPLFINIHNMSPSVGQIMIKNARPKAHRANGSTLNLMGREDIYV
jgi:hypothetical protein